MKSKRLSKKVRGMEAYFRLLTFSNILHISNSVESADNNKNPLVRKKRVSIN